jgi:hypothetical protein
MLGQRFHCKGIPPFCIPATSVSLGWKFGYFMQALIVSTARKTTELSWPSGHRGGEHQEMPGLIDNQAAQKPVQAPVCTR